ncbi:DUF4192 domain-containing protein [Bifidobacterium scaligerum]|uniref:DUF4192 domain-containing protein n=1 Tax=Bifidobacterium scaligerum TaxID=2052656 RepID=A0A2M9HSD2_9BIFI|nr:DUF4192 domain-containing protein [Bifidobacterium scaligerum]PJM79723.1 DUF4192 domain-containing protein [Bifidobacterium scaligerum]
MYAEQYAAPSVEEQWRPDYEDRCTMERLAMKAETFHNNRLTRGIRRANEEWISQPLDDWLEGLGQDDILLSADVMESFVVGMQETLSIRDALILSLVTDEQHCPRAQLMDFATRPHAARTKKRMGQLLTEAFEDETIRPDERRCRRGVAMLFEMVHAYPFAPACIQPLAVIAYALWWLGDEESTVYALQCLLLDQECSLAAMVFSASERGVRPAWCSRKSAMPLE